MLGIDLDKAWEMERKEMNKLGDKVKGPTGSTARTDRFMVKYGCKGVPGHADQSQTQR